MSQESERIYTIPLGKALISQKQHRAVRAINMIREFARRHMKTDDVRIDEELNYKIWHRGVRSPPRKIRVIMEKTDEGFILVSPYDESTVSPKSDEAKEQPVTVQDDEAVKEGPAPETDETGAEQKLEEPSARPEAGEPAVEKLEEQSEKSKVDAPTEQKLEEPPEKLKTDEPIEGSDESKPKSKADMGKPSEKSKADESAAEQKLEEQSEKPTETDATADKTEAPEKPKDDPKND